MDITYKLVSDWNTKYDFSTSNETKGIIPIASDSLFSPSLNSGSYSIRLNASGVKCGTFSKTLSYNIYYFTYENNVETLEKIEIDGQEINGVSPNLSFKSNGNPIILYYDLNSFSISAVEKDSGSWVLTNIDYVNIELPVFKRQIASFNSDGKIYGVYICNFNNEQSVIKYTYFDGSTWTYEVVDEDDDGARFLSVSIINNSLGESYIFAGTESGISVYERIRGNWSLDRIQDSCPTVREIEASYDDVNDYTHIAYVSGTVVKYQRYDHSLSSLMNRFFIRGKFIDFNSSSVSIDTNLDGNPLISYSHIEESTPIQVFLKIARGSEYGNTFKTYNIDKSFASYIGYLSDFVFDQNDKICILYYNNGIKLYDEQKDIDEDNVETSSWKDRLLVNNLTASSNPPTRDAQNTYINFDRSQEQCFYIADSSSTDLDESTTAFSILFTIIPNGNILDSQTIVSKSSDSAGYEIFLGGSLGLSIGISLYTIYGSISTYVADLPVDEPSKVGVVYSGYDVKVYIKSSLDDSFTVYKYDVFGSVKKTDNPFVIGAYGVKNDVISGGYPYPISSDDFTFSSYLDAKLIGLKYWKRELNYAEASYNESDIVSYNMDIDPYSNNIDYVTFRSSFGSRHFITVGDNLGVDDYGGVDKINMVSYSDFDSEDRITNSVGYSVDPFMVKKSLGGMFIVWSDKTTGYSEIYANDFNSNHSIGFLNNANSTMKSFGRNGKTVSNSNLFADPKANFSSSGVFCGDFLCITSGTEYVGRRIPVISVISDTCLEIGAYFSQSVNDLGYYIDTNVENNGNDIPVKITNLEQTSLSPVAVSDSANDIHIVFQSLFGEYYELYYQRYRPSNSSNQIWGSVRITSKNGHSIHPSLAISNDVLHVVWEDERNKSHSIMYGRSSCVSSYGEANFVDWSTSNMGGSDVLISSNLYAEDPFIIVDSDGVIHVVFSARIISTDSEKYEIYYCNNQNGVFTNPVRITSLSGRVANASIVIDKFMNRYVCFNCRQSISEDVYIVKYDSAFKHWNLPKKISFSDADSINPSICIDADDVIYIYWIDSSSSSDSIGFAKYDADSGEVYSYNIRPSSSPSTISNLSVSLDETKTAYLSWEDYRFGNNVGTEIYKNETINLVNFDAIALIDEDSKTDEEIVSDQLNKFVIGKKYSDEISPSELPLSSEAIGDVVITFNSYRYSYTIPVDMFNRQNPLATAETIILDSRDVVIKIKGLPRTLAYRIKNIDDQESTYSEFYEFSIDEFPDITVANWRLSSENGAKTVGIQLYTFQGLASPIIIDLYLNEPNIYDILIFNDDGNTIGEAVSTEYQNVKVLSFKNYWVKIKPYRVVDNNQLVKFDLITQGNSILNVSTIFDGEYYVGKFSVNVHDGVRYIDGNAKIIPKIVTE